MRTFSVVFLCLTFICVVTSMTAAHHPETPAEIEGVKIVSLEEAKTLINKEEVIVFDTRRANHYATGHIKNAISLPFKWVTYGDIRSRRGAFDTSKLPSDKNAQVIVYSDGVHNWDSYHVSKEARTRGYKHILWLKDGYEGWIKKGYPIEQ